MLTSTLWDTILSSPTGSSRRQIYLLWLTLPLPGGEQEVEESLPVCPRLLQHQLLWQQICKQKIHTHTHTHTYIHPFIPITLCPYSQSHDKGHHPKGMISCAGYKVLTSLQDYVDLMGDSLPGVCVWWCVHCCWRRFERVRCCSRKDDIIHMRVE